MTVTIVAVAVTVTIVAGRGRWGEGVVYGSCEGEQRVVFHRVSGGKVSTGSMRRDTWDMATQ